MNTLLTLLGSCRLNGIKRHFNTTNLNEQITYTHSTKEHIQLIKFISGKQPLPLPPYNWYCFRTSIMQPRKIYEKHFGDPKGDALPNYWKANKIDCGIQINTNHINQFNNTTHFIVEICSNALYISNNYFLHHLAVDPRFDEYRLTDLDIINNTIKKYQNIEEIKSDILELKNLLQPKKMVIVTHINAKNGNTVLNRRDNLIQTLEIICKEYNISIINPTMILEHNRQDRILTNDLGHYTPYGEQVVGSLFKREIEKILRGEL